MTSNETQNLPATESLFDFLYLDRSRIASYFAQLFETGGVLTATKTTASTQKSSAEGGHAGIPKVLGYDMQEASVAARTLERQFDASWALPLNVINKLDELGLIVRDIAAAHTGQLILMQGNLQLLDMRMVQALWKPIMHQELEKLPDKTGPERVTKKNKTASMSNMVELIEGLPHTLQVKLFNEHHQAWATLDPDGLIGNSADIVLKHGVTVQGIWTLIGVLDALPDGDHDLKLPRVHGELEAAFLKMHLQLRSLFGRGYKDHGVTPIAILREVGARDRE